MPIKVTCICGKGLTVPDEAAGRRARCPACNAVVNVPGSPPEPPPPEPEPLAGGGKMDEVFDGFAADLAKSRERAPQLTQIAMALLIWSGASFVLSLLGSLFADLTQGGSLVLWFLIWLPQSIASALLALAIIKAWPRTPEAIDLAAPLIAGASYVTFWTRAINVGGASALFFVVAGVSLGGWAFLYWYFRWHGAAALFAPAEAEGVADTAAAADEPSKGESEA